MIQVTRFIKWKILIGVPLVILAVLIPMVATEESFGIVKKIQEGLEYHSQIKLLEGVFRLAALNAVYSYPRYLGAFFISAAVMFFYRGHRQLWVNMAVAVFIAGAINIFNGTYYGSQRISALPLFAIPVLQLFLWSLDYPNVNTARRLPIMICVLTGFQFINLMPALEHLSLGRDLVAVYVKSVLVSQGLRHTLNITMLICAAISFAVGGLLLLLIHNENKLIQINRLKAENTEILMSTRIQEMQNRSNWELKHLVHDLKTPLTTVQTLAYVVKLHQGEGQELCSEYLERIEASVEHMSKMISEILYEDRRGSMTTEALLNVVLAQLSASTYASAIKSVNEIPQMTVDINGIRMARTLINLVENSYHSKSAEPLEIVISVRSEGEMVAISVKDNGIGIPEDRQEAVWQRGESMQGSSGLGLPYVRETVEQCDGSVRLSSEVGVGTEITILLPKGEVSYE